jgi:hypothetical protein
MFAVAAPENRFTAVKLSQENRFSKHFAKILESADQLRGGRLRSICVR